MPELRDLDSPGSPDELYRDRGDVEISVPINQGDIFAGIEIPSLAPEPLVVQVVMHPCSLRKGAVLRERITVAPVRPLGENVSDRTWKRRHLNSMLLPDLFEDGTTYHADLRDVAPARTDQLHLPRRISALSNRGILLLQQRLVYAQTRLALPLSDFQAVSKPVLTELEMQESWVSTALDANQDQQDIPTALTAGQLEFSRS